MKKTITLLVLIFTFTQTFACDYEEMSFLWWYFKSDLIFTGKIIKVFESDSASYDVQILIDKVYKGKTKDTLQLTVHSYHENGQVASDCDVYMKPNEKWLIYSIKEIDKYCTGGQESRSNQISNIERYHPKDFDWLESINFKVTDFYWNWNEYDIAPKANNINSIIQENFNTTTVDTSSIHGIRAFVLCNIDEYGILNKANLFYYPNGFKSETDRIIFEKFEYLNPEVKCFTDFQREAVRITKMINNWTPTVFCGKNVKGQVLIKYFYENGKIQTEIRK